MSIDVQPGERPGKVAVATKQVGDIHYPIYAASVVSAYNSSTTELANGEAFTGEWEDVGHFNNVVVTVKTDQNGYYEIQFSPDGINQDSTLTRYYRTTQIEPPHKFTITRQYCRVVFYNNSGSNQTYLRLQTIYGDKSDLNIPQDATMSQDYDAIATRPTDYRIEAALGRRQGANVWNKFGYNQDVDTATSPEVVAAFGGTFTPSTVASTLTIVSSSINDDSGGTGCNSIVIYGVDQNWDLQTEVVTMDGTTNVVTTTQWIGINRVAMYLCGTGLVNAGTITITKTTGGAILATMPLNGGVTQQCIFYIPQNHQFLAEWLFLNAARNAATNPFVTFVMWVFSAVNNGKQEVLRYSIDTDVEVSWEFRPKLPFTIGEKSILWIEATTDQNDTIVNARFSGALIRDIDA